MMDLVLIILTSVIGLFLGGLIAWFILVRPGKKKIGDQTESVFLILQKQLEEIRGTLDNKLGESTKAIQRQFGESARIVRDVTERLTKLDETNKQVVGFADQLQSLQDILQNPKRRGVLGEYYLETILKNVLPPSVYKMQYKIGKDDNEADLIVDAVIFIQDKVIPIDSKFSLENYNRLAEERNETERERLEKLFKQDLKNRIDETSKYIQPDKGTMEFALMFIPSEAIFYDLIINKVGAVKVNTEELIQYAARKKVNVVSPNSFYAFLQVILQGINQMKIEKNTEIIQKRVGELGKHLKNYEEFYNKVGNNLGTTVNTFNKASKELKKINKDVLRISGEEYEIEPVLLDKPDEID